MWFSKIDSYLLKNDASSKVLLNFNDYFPNMTRKLLLFSVEQVVLQKVFVKIDEIF